MAKKTQLHPGAITGRRYGSFAGKPPSAIAATFTFTVRATDSLGYYGDRTYTLTVDGLTRYLFSIRATDAASKLGQQAYEMFLRTP